MKRYISKASNFIIKVYTKILNRLKCWRYGHDYSVHEQIMVHTRITNPTMKYCTRCGKWSKS